MPLIDKTIPARVPLPHGESRRIPPLIFQTFKTPELPNLMYEAVQSWIEHNPGFEYRFFDDDAQAAFIRDNFDPDVFSAYQKIEGGAFRADLWRYCVLWIHGGVYADIDTVCRSDLTPELASRGRIRRARHGRECPLGRVQRLHRRNTPSSVPQARDRPRDRAGSLRKTFCRL